MDGREVLDPEIADEVGDPSAAFDALCAAVKDQGRTIGAEMTVMRKGVEALHDRVDRLATPIDYSPDLGRLGEQQEVVVRRLDRIEALPLLHRSPEYYAGALERAVRDAFYDMVRALEAQATGLARVRRDLAGQLESARERRQQDWHLVWFAGVGLFVGLLLGMVSLVLLPRSIGLGLDLRVAANVLGMDRWKAGIALMRSGDPATWDWMMDAYKLKKANQQAIVACAAVAAKAKQDQSCTITVAAP